MTTEKPDQFVRRLITAAPVVLGLIACGAVLAFSLPRGLNLTDESFYLLGYRHPEDVSLCLTQFHQIVGRLLGLGNLSIITYRILGVTLGIVSAAALGIAASIAWNPEATPRARIMVALLAALGSLMQFSWGPRGLSYNTLSGALCLLDFAGLFMLSSTDPSSPKRARRWAIAAFFLGCSLGAHLLIKSSTALLSGLFIAPWLVFRVGGPLRRRIGVVLALGAGVVLLPAWYFGRVLSLPQFLANFFQVKSAQSEFFSAKAIWLGTISTSLGSFKRILPAAAGIAILVALAGRLRRRGKGAQALAVEAVAIVALCIYVLLKSSYAGGTTHIERMYMPHFLIAVLAFAAWLDHGWYSQPRSVVVRRAAIGLTLLALPLIATLGSSNMVIVQMLLHLAPWFVFSAVAIEDLSVLRGSIVPGVIPWLMAPVVVTHVYGGQVAAPFLISGPMTEQTAPLPSPNEHIMVHPSIATSVSEIRSLLEGVGFRGDERIWMIYNGPGLVYLVGGRAPQTPWLYSGPFARFDCLAFERTAVDRSREFLILSADPAPELRACMANSGRPLESFQLLGEATDPGIVGMETPRLRVLVRSTPGSTVNAEWPLHSNVAP